MLHPTFLAQLPLVKKLLKEHKIKKAYAFGSVVSDKFNNESDIDLLINIEEGLDPMEKGELLWSLLFALEDQLHRKIDLLEEANIKNPYFIEELNEKKQLIYEA